MYVLYNIADWSPDRRRWDPRVRSNQVLESAALGRWPAPPKLHCCRLWVGLGLQPSPQLHRTRNPVSPVTGIGQAHRARLWQGGADASPPSFPPTVPGTQHQMSLAALVRSRKGGGSPAAARAADNLASRSVLSARHTVNIQPGGWCQRTGAFSKAVQTGRWVRSLGGTRTKRKIWVTTRPKAGCTPSPKSRRRF